MFTCKVVPFAKQLVYKSKTVFDIMLKMICHKWLLVNNYAHTFRTPFDKQQTTFISICVPRKFIQMNKCVFNEQKHTVHHRFIYIESILKPA